MKNYTFIDYATQGYMALVGLLILCFHNDTVPAGPGWWALNAAGLVLVHLLIQAHARRPRPGCSISSAISIRCCSTRAFFRRDRLAEPHVLPGLPRSDGAQWEQELCGCQPSVLFMDKLPWLAVSELFYMPRTSPITS